MPKKNRFFYHPLFSCFIGFALGILTADFLYEVGCFIYFDLFFICIFGLTILLLLFLFRIISRRFEQRKLFGYSACILFFFLGIFRVYCENPKEFEWNKGEEYHCCVRVEKNLTEKAKSWQTHLRILSIYDSTKKTWHSQDQLILAYFEKQNTISALCYGQYLYVKIHPKKIDYSSYGKFLRRNQILYSCYIPFSNLHLSDLPPTPSLRLYASQAQKKCISILQKSKLSSNEYGLASALLLGDLNEMDPDLKTAYRHAGLIHILCVSGLHIGLFSSFLLFLLSFLPFRPWINIFKLSMVCLSIWSYAFIVGLSPSVMRAACMFSFVCIGQCLGRKTDIYRSLLCAAIFLLLLNPYTFFSIGFQLSFLAIIGIVALSPFWIEIWKPKNRILYYIWSLNCVSLAAQLATAPLVIHYFGQFPNYFLLSNLIGSPFASLLLPCGIFFLGFSFVGDFLFQFTENIFQFLLQFLNQSVLYIEKLPFSLWENISLSLTGSLCIYFFLLFAMGVVKQKKKIYVYSALFSLWGFVLFA